MTPDEQPRVEAMHSFDFADSTLWQVLMFGVGWWFAPIFALLSWITARPIIIGKRKTR